LNVLFIFIYVVVVAHEKKLTLSIVYIQQLIASNACAGIVCPQTSPSSWLV